MHSSRVKYNGCKWRKLNICADFLPSICSQHGGRGWQTIHWRAVTHTRIQDNAIKLLDPNTFNTISWAQACFMAEFWFWYLEYEITTAPLASDVQEILSFTCPGVFFSTFNRFTNPGFTNPVFSGTDDIQWQKHDWQPEPRTKVSFSVSPSANNRYDIIKLKVIGTAICKAHSRTSVPMAITAITFVQQLPLLNSGRYTSGIWVTFSIELVQ